MWIGDTMKWEKKSQKQTSKKKNHEESQHRKYIKSSGILEMYISVLNLKK